MTLKADSIPNSFFWRRFHSILGLWLVVFLIEHLLTNSQAALFIGADGHGFINSVNWISDLPYLPVIEIIFLGLPIIVHGVWGIKYALTAKFNSSPTDGTSPSLPEYAENKAYTWQRVTSWLLILGIIAHVVQMRFIEYPHSVQRGNEKLYMVRLSLDPGLYTLSQRLGVSLFNNEQIIKEREEVGPKASHSKKQKIRSFLTSFKDMFAREQRIVSSRDATTILQAQRLTQERDWVEALEKKPLGEDQIMVVTHDFATASLLMVRDTFKSPVMILLYTLFVLAAVFHACNGVWTFLIKWGVTLSERGQRIARFATTGLMVVLTFLGLSAVWLTYWINLRS